MGMSATRLNGRWVTFAQSIEPCPIDGLRRKDVPGGGCGGADEIGVQVLGWHADIDKKSIGVWQLSIVAEEARTDSIVPIYGDEIRSPGVNRIRHASKDLRLCERLQID
jgi:hypothetical protein